MLFFAFTDVEITNLKEAGHRKRFSKYRCNLLQAYYSNDLDIVTRS